MNIRYANAPVFLGPSDWLDGSLTQIDGDTVVVKPDGRVVSVQPDGTVSDRDPGTHGAWERLTVDPTINVLRYTVEGIRYAVAYRGR